MPDEVAARIRCILQNAQAGPIGTGSSDKPRSRGAERMRLYRRRRRRQDRILRIEIAAAEIDELVKRGYLDPNNCMDLSAIGLAASAFLSDALGGWA